MSTKSLPEHSLSSILGLCTSAPAAPMSIYLGTIQRGLPKGWIEGSIDNISGAISRESSHFRSHIVYFTR